MQTSLTSERLLPMPIDFSQCRPELWPTLALEMYEVCQVHSASAEVKERSPQRVRIRSSLLIRIPFFCYRGDELSDGRPSAIAGVDPRRRPGIRRQFCSPLIRPASIPVAELFER